MNVLKCSQIVDLLYAKVQEASFLKVRLYREDIETVPYKSG